MMMEIVYLVLGILIGAVVAWFAAKSKFQQLLPFTKEQYESSQLEISKLKVELAQLQGAKAHLDDSLSEVKELLERERENGIQLTRELSEAQTDNKNLMVRIEEQKKEIEQINQRLTAEFKNIANTILEEKAKAFTEHNKINLDSILTPLKERIEEFKKQVESTYEKETRETLSLKDEVKRLSELNTRISEDANNLTRALKGDTKTQGNWGEFILEKILEQSGLEKDREYKTQFSTKNVDGETIRPDVIVFLPDNKHVVVDSKVSLTAYEAFISATNEEEREQYKKEHVASLRNHIKLLADKSYETADKLNIPDFVLMFVPIESSFGIAVQTDKELFTFGWEKKIIIVSPSTLLATLKIIASTWKQEKQNRNALEIAKQGGALYDKFVGFLADMTEVGKKMDSAKESYKDAMAKLFEGRGNIVKSIENLKALGAKTVKSLDQRFLDKADE